VRTLGIRKRNEQEANSYEHRELAEDVHIVLDTFSSQIVPRYRQFGQHILIATIARTKELLTFSVALRRQ
jgi:hypothetical protein